MLTHSLAHSLLTHSLLTHSLTHSLAHSLTNSLTHPLTQYEGDKKVLAEDRSTDESALAYKQHYANLKFHRGYNAPDKTGEEAYKPEREDKYSWKLGAGVITIYSLTHTLTHTHSLTHSLTRLLTLTHSLTHSLLNP